MCGNIAADDDSCPGVGSPEVDRLDADLAADDAGNPEFQGIRCGPLTEQVNSAGECCYYALVGYEDTACPD